jgi:hypothetical protein
MVIQSKLKKFQFLRLVLENFNLKATLILYLNKLSALLQTPSLVFTVGSYLNHKHVHSITSHNNSQM